MDDANHLRAFVERIERLHEEKRTIEDDVKDVYAELASAGYDKKAVREVVKRRSKDPIDFQEFEAIVDLYMQAVAGPSREHARDARETRTREASEILSPAISTAVQDEAAAGSSPEEEVRAEAGGAQEDRQTAERAPFVTSAGTGEAAHNTVDPVPAADERPSFVLKPYELRPHCQRPDRCAGYGAKHCFPCRQAAGLTEAA